MDAQFAANSIPLSRLLAPPFLVETPAYQRSYAWTDVEAGRLLDDLLAAADADMGTWEDYFLGTILLVDRDAGGAREPGWPFSNSPRKFEVVDGLQRLTTLAIVFCVLRDVARDNGEKADPLVEGAIHADPPGTPWLSLRGSDETFFASCVRDGRRAVEMRADAPACEERILAVRNMFQGKLSLLDRPARERLARFLLSHCYIVLITTTGIDRAHRMFLVLNERGKPLARHDILKADCLGRLPPETAPRIAAVWEGMEARLGDDFEALFAHVRAINGRPGGPIIASIRALVDGAGGAEAFVTGVLKPAADALDEIRRGHTARWPQASEEIGGRLRYLHWLPNSDWVPPALQFWLGGPRSAAAALAFLEALDKLAYGFKIMGLGGPKRATRFAAVTAALRRGEDVLAPASPLALSGQEERAIRYCLRNMHQRAPAVAKLLLLRLNDRIAGAPQHIDPDSLTVEHVLPRKTGVQSRWREWFPEPEERAACTESLGNLVLVSKAQNDKASNLELERKQAVYFQPGSPVPPINEALRTVSRWGPHEVRAREAELLAHLDAIWDLDLAPQPGGNG
ncbi:MAG: DUF262 domain-containing HNH endonuclease family protein [Hyphomicrobiaceae bacterium]|nr:DUF262 domain-containing HNH endonuclease family protein [Hyphomicrobiaceae bacterium]